MFKRYSSTLLSLCATAFLACIISPAKGQSPDVLSLKQTILLRAVHGGFNHMSVDERRQRLFVPAPADKMVEVIDLRSRKVWRTLPMGRPTTALYVPASDQLYVTSGRILSIYDGSTLNHVESIDLHSRLDQIQYDASARELYIGRMTTGDTGIAIVAVPQGKLVAIITLPSSPQGFAIESGGPHLFVNLPDDGSVAVVDRRKRKLAAIWKLKGAGDNFPMALDEQDERLLIATRTPAKMLALDTQTGKTVTTIPCVEQADDMWYDARQRRIYISGGGGSMSVIQQKAADQYDPLEQIRTGPDASNSALSDRMRSLYIGVPYRDGEKAEIRVYGIGP